ncbi:MAG: chromate transporter [Hyphomicrobiales bacterium]|nr:chromate transporter [Hyphomicrobiales bacterium]
MPAHSGDVPTARVTLLELFLLFSQLGLSSFGGAVSAWVHRAFVERRELIGEAEFAAALGLARIIPGANVVNLAVMLGHRLRGAAGAIAAGLGLILGPTLVAIALMIAYRRWGGSPGSRALLEGAAAASVGLLIAMGLAAGAYLIGIGTKSERDDVSSNRHHAPSFWSMIFFRKPVSTFRDHALWTWRNAANTALIGAVFILIGVLHFRMVPTVLVLTPASIALAYLFPLPRD